MKILGICGTHRKQKEKSSSWFLLQEALKAAKEKGAEIDAINLVDFNILPCLGCETCLDGKPCPQLQKKEDEALKVVEKIQSADGIIFSYPVYGCEPPAVLFHFIDRGPGLMQHFMGEGILGGIQPFGHFSPLAGKFIGIIVNAGGMGMQSALSFLSQASIMAKAFPVACAGVALMEYQRGNPAIPEAVKNKIESADWAIEMAGAVGKRVVDAYNSPGLPILKAMAGIKEAPVEEKEAAVEGVIWTKEAEEALKNIPRLVRPMAKKAIEKHAKEKGASEITVDLMLEVKKKMGR